MGCGDACPGMLPNSLSTGRCRSEKYGTGPINEVRDLIAGKVKQLLSDLQKCFRFAGSILLFYSKRLSFADLRQQAQDLEAATKRWLPATERAPYHSMYLGRHFSAVFDHVEVEDKVQRRQATTKTEKPIPRALPHAERNIDPEMHAARWRSK